MTIDRGRAGLDCWDGLGPELRLELIIASRILSTIVPSVDVYVACGMICLPYISQQAVTSIRRPRCTSWLPVPRGSLAAVYDRTPRGSCGERAIPMKVLVPGAGGALTHSGSALNQLPRRSGI